MPSAAASRSARLVDDDRVLAAHLGDDPLQPALARLHLRRQRVDVRAHLARASERDEPRPRMRDQEVADLAAAAGQEVHHAGRHAGLLEQLDQARRDDRRQARPASGSPCCR